MNLPNLRFPRPLTLSLASMLAFTGAALAAGDADAQSRERHRAGAVSGPRVEANRQVNVFRSPSSATVTRQGEINGRPWSSSRVRSSARTDNGFTSATTRVGRGGTARSRTRNVSVDDGYYDRSVSVETSNGRGYDYDVTAVDTGEAVTVTRNLTTNGGAVRYGTVTRPY